MAYNEQVNMLNDTYNQSADGAAGQSEMQTSMQKPRNPYETTSQVSFSA